MACWRDGLLPEASGDCPAQKIRSYVAHRCARVVVDRAKPAAPKPAQGELRRSSVICRNGSGIKSLGNLPYWQYRLRLTKEQITYAIPGMCSDSVWRNLP
jgi:hypothetical protein